MGASRSRRKRLRALADLAISMEIFADDVHRAYRKWISEPPLSEEVRRKYAGAMRLLAEQGNNVCVGYRDARFVIASEGATAGGPVEDVASVAFQIIEAMGCEQMLQRLVEALRSIAGRMEVPFSAETQNQIADDWRAMNQLAESVRDIARALRERCRDNVRLARLPNVVQNAIDSLKDHVQLMLSDMASLIVVTPEEAAEIDRRVEAMVERAEQYGKICSDVRRPLAVFVEQHLKETQARNISLANEIDYLLERVSDLFRHANNLVVFAVSRLDAARALDPDIEEDARELGAAVRSMRAEHESLQAMIDRYREIVSRAPYRYFQRTKPLPEWDALGAQERAVITALVVQRSVDADGEYAVATQATIETAMGTNTAGRKPSVTVLRLLKRLESEHQIVGIYPVPPSAGQQQKFNHFWITEDAYAKYRRVALTPSRG